MRPFHRSIWLPLSIALALAACAEPNPGGLGFDDSEDAGMTSLREAPRAPSSPGESSNGGADGGQPDGSGGFGGAETGVEPDATVEPEVVVPDDEEPDATPDTGGTQENPDVEVVEADPTCNDGCLFALDGYCDDGGPDAETDYCELGSDCGDCGPGDRTGSGGGGDGGGDDGGGGDGDACSNTCEYANDFECDDGGPGADYDLCALGTDCNDCGPRDGSSGGGGVCSNSCTFAFDGECDDGGPGSAYDLCTLGTDCFDCGPR